MIYQSSINNVLYENYLYFVRIHYTDCFSLHTNVYYISGVGANVLILDLSISLYKFQERINIILKRSLLHLMFLWQNHC